MFLVAMNGITAGMLGMTAPPTRIQTACSVYEY